MNSNHHKPVMFNESIKALNIKKDGVYIDATFGRGGHAQGILDQLGDNGQLIAFDQDLNATQYADKHFNDKRLTVVHDVFSNMDKTLNQQDLLGKVNGILIDLGVSSPQLDDPQRGFSFNADGPLDMRMNQTKGVSAAEWLKTATEEEIANVIYQFGDERKSRQIASKIKQYQQNNKLTNTQQLVNIISTVIKFQKNKHPATRTFQAIRIFINQELKQLTDTLEQLKNILNRDARLVIISFHSTEDRIVKKFIQTNSRAKSAPKGLPISNQQTEKTLFKDLGKQFASPTEITNNKRSRSAILRVASRN